jgi:hypothetical protein
MFGGILWCLFALGFLALPIEYIVGVAGLQVWIPLVSSESIFVGLVHLTGFYAASVFCFVIGTGLWAHGRVLPERVDQVKSRNQETGVKQPDP